MVSGLEDEYELSSRLPRLLYVKEPAPDREAGLARLLARFQTEGSVSYRRFTGPDELAGLIADDLAVLLSERFGAASSPGSPRLQRPAVPVPLTPTIGRRREITAVAGLLRRGVRLVTITGTGGVGKSRLAVTVALELVAEDRGGVYFISLTPVTDPRHLIATIAGHVGARLDTAAPLDALADYLRDRPAVLVEHWIRLKTSNPIGSAFATVGLCTKVAKGLGSRAAGVAMVFKLVHAAESAGLRQRSHVVALVRAGARFGRGVMVERPDEAQTKVAA
jgi:hypothetical protein